MEGDETTAVYRVAYEEAVRALSGRRELLESLRTRAGLLLTAAVITSSFLSSRALGGILTWIALLAFATTSGVCLAVLWPRNWELSINAAAIIGVDLASPGGLSLRSLYEGLALLSSGAYQRNRLGLERLGRLLQIAGGMLSLEVTLWIAAVAFRV